MKIYREKDVDSFALAGREVAVIGYGNQGKAQAMNLRDSGVKVVIALREGSERMKTATRDGFRVGKIEDVVGRVHVIAMLIPDEFHMDVWNKYLKGRLREKAMVVFASTVAVHFEGMTFDSNIDVVLVGPMGPGDALRSEYRAGRGLPAKVSVMQDASGRALDMCLAYAGALGCARVGCIETTFKTEAELDLFSEQVVLCGGIPYLALRAFEVLIEKGYPPEQAYIETVQEIRAIADLMFRYGIDGMRRRISTTALYGGKVAGESLIDDEVRDKMLSLLESIRSGRFYKKFKGERPVNRQELEAIPDDMREAREKVSKLFISDVDRLFGR
ncbi:MAG TPA: ketol-acid reductoisomerase [Firmicutes bacterium]|nr:ketol-acid reductoisomerase [Bacillota bacterium]